MAAASILNFQKVLLLTLDDTNIAHIYQHIKFGANWSRIGWDMSFCVFSKMAAAAILNFQKVTCGPLMTLALQVSINTPNLVQIDPELAEIHPFVYFQDGGRRHLEFLKSDILDPWWHFYCPYLQTHQTWCISIQNWLRYTLLCIFKMASAAILNFQKSVIFNPDDTYIANIYQYIKFGANRPKTGWDTPFCVFSKMAAAAILDMLFVDFGPSTMSQLLGSMLPANGTTISLNLSEILWF